MDNIPKEIHGYKIIEELGTGSYGIVYKVIKENESKEYVLKQIPLKGLTKPEMKYIENESKFLSKLNSKYVVKYIDSFNEDNKLNIIMEYCNEGDLGKFLLEEKKKVNHLSEELIWKLFLQISIGVAYLHNKKILHRDLKSFNIFLTDNLKVKIGDLGVAKKLEKGKFATTFIGTPYYLSPEICNNKEYNNKSDVWAVGCLLFELCTFNHPFEANSQGALVIKIMNDPVGEISDDFSIDLKNLTKILLEKDDIIRPSMKAILSRNEVQENAKKYGFYDDLYEIIKKKNVKKIKKKKKGNKLVNNDKKKIKISRPSSAVPKQNIKISRPSSAVPRKNYNLINQDKNLINIKKDIGVHKVKKSINEGNKKFKAPSYGKNIKKPNVKISKEKNDNPVIIKNIFDKKINEVDKKQNINKKKENVQKKIEHDIQSNKKMGKKIIKKDNKIENKKEVKKDNIMDYKATDFFNNLNKAKPVIIKETKAIKEDKSLLGMFLNSNENNNNQNLNNDIISHINQQNINEEYSENKIEIPNLNDLLNDFDEEEENKEEENLIENKEEENLIENKEENIIENKKEENLIEKKEDQYKEEIIESKEDENINYKDNNNKNEQNCNSFEKIYNKKIFSKSMDDIELINKKIINKNFEKIDDKDILNNSINYNDKKKIDFENDESDDEGVNINNNLSENDIDNEEEDEIDINENKKEEKFNKEEEKEKILKTIEELKIKLKTLIGENDYNTFIILYNKLNESNKIDNDIYNEIEEFFEKNYESDKKIEVQQIYLLLITNGIRLNKFN